MKNASLLAIATLCVASAAMAGPVESTPLAPVTQPAAQSGGFFLGVDGGAFWLQEASGHWGNISGDVHFRTGWSIDVPMGYDFGNGFKAFLSVGYDEAGLSSGHVDVNGTHYEESLQGHAQIVPIMANSSYSFNLTDRLHWNIGAGLGTVNYKAPVDGIGGLGIPTGAWNTGSKWVFGFNAFTGLSYDVAPCCALNLGYRYLYINQARDNLSGGNGNGHSLLGGFTFKF